jgi:hypothetical protein
MLSFNCFNTSSSQGYMIRVSPRGLLDRSKARYFYKGSKTSLHKHKGNLVENLFYKKCAFKNSLQLLT